MRHVRGVGGVCMSESERGKERKKKKDKAAPANRAMRGMQHLFYCQLSQTVEMVVMPASDMDA